MEVIRLLEGFAAALDGRLHLHLRRPRRCMAACYEGGAFYTPHRDNDLDPSTGELKNRRALTAIFYANDPDWTIEQGGALRCHPNVGPAAGSAQPLKPSQEVPMPEAAGAVDILPSGGRVVLFDSRRLLHEVLPAKDRRWAISVWFVTEDASAA
ncbi:unnamed protein product [Prorocentrum cordatum]|uniref:Fe2OG dioxygenase domain-containing protein n=1 Tax=Prorocentrum cordatum TaxID=2364126 RepID=A0ABN9TAQ7_9DINO|nr:unnamed protein product [Polarella glacialis]